MKVCSKCGVPQKDSNFRCVECGAVLGKPLTEEEEEIANGQISDYIDERADKSDDFHIGLREKILIIADILGFILSIVVLLCISNEPDGDYICLMTALMFILGAVNTAFPKLSWELEKHRLSRYVDTYDLSPSDWYVTSQKITKIAVPVIGALLLLFVAFESANLPSGTYIGSDVIHTEMGDIIIDRYYS